MRVLVTGNAGFIGFHVAQRLLERGADVVGFDAVNSYYEPALKEARLAALQRVAAEARGSYQFVRGDLADRTAVEALFAAPSFDRVVHLAAQAGVRYSLENPRAYVDANITGFLNLLEGCRTTRVPHLVYASSSSVYGLNAARPFSVHHPADHPASLYAATKKSGEMLAHAYSQVFDLPATGLRFFTVYGPWGRPDMAYFSFTRAILADRTIELYGSGEMERDFTYIDDVVEAVLRIIDRVAAPDPAWDAQRPDPAASSAPYRLYNVGNRSPVKLTRLVAILEQLLGRKARVTWRPAPRGEVPVTAADVDDLIRDAGFAPGTPLEAGLAEFTRWFRTHYRN